MPTRGAPLDDNVARSLLRMMFDAAVAAADPAQVLASHLPDPPRGRCVVVGGGKASAAMAAAVEAAWPGVDLSGAVAVPYGYGVATQRIAVREAGHPIPDASSEAAAREMLQLVCGLNRDDMVLALISGGGSATMALPIDGMSLADKQAVYRALLASGLDIRSMNAVRRRLSAIKGGKLAAAAAPAPVVTLAISDIPGDEIADIASGPTLPDPDATRDLTPMLQQLRDRIAAPVYQRLTAPVPSPSPLPSVEARLIATPRAALEAAADVARANGIRPIILGDSLEGESRFLAAEMAKQVGGHQDEPLVLLSGGETTVELTGSTPGRGGRNSEFALAMALALDGRPGVWALAGDTDGEDGACGGAAGAFIGPDTLARGRAKGLEAAAFLDRHDSAGFFEPLGDLLVTGPTLTNVNDFRAILIAGA